ncbi:MAG: 5-demethoxyubiquinol-8 5-hydroxylase UbiM [Cardiobacteriaceae bacterium]|nr:5-demethoxyubiquinol-8 5-hydroxylase UbiM [Cardiobacteriaceae bacterium]
MQEQTDIIVVGAGPAGLSFCRALAGSSLNISVVESHSQEVLENPPFDGREIALTHPSKGILENLGIWQRFPQDDIHFLRAASVRNGDSDFRLYFPVPSVNSHREPIDTLGYLVSNHVIRKAAYEAVQTQENIRWHIGRRMVGCTSDAGAATVTLDNGETLRGALLVAADSRFSFTRRAMGIPADTHEFGRVVLVFRLEHEYSNDHTASECFFYGSTLALLPLTDHTTNCVVTIDSRKAPELLAMDGDTLADYVAIKIEHRLGAMKLCSSVHDYPLIGVHARRFYANRCALIGDTACGMHPVTAHGFNLGLQSQEILSRLILRQAGQGKDIGDPALLAAYDRRHQLNTRPLYHGTNAIVKLFTRETLPAKCLRHGVLRLSQSLPPLKRLITRQLTG